MFGSRIDDNQLERIYDDFSREQGMLMTDLKTKQEEDKEKDIMKELTLINSLMMNTLRLTAQFYRRPIQRYSKTTIYVVGKTMRPTTSTILPWCT